MAAIRAALAALWDCTPSDIIFAGSLGRDDGIAGAINRSTRIATRQREINSLNELVRGVGWTIARNIDGPFSHSFSLKKI